MTKSQQIHDRRKSVVDKLKAARIAKGMSQAQLAEILGINPATVSKIEGNKWNMTIDVISAFCIALGIDELRL